MKYRRLLLLTIFIGFPAFAYEQQGFSTYQELDGNVSFNCPQQCYVLLGPLAGSDYLSRDGILEGNGTVGYGFLIGQQVVPGDILQVNGSLPVHQQSDFSRSPYFSQIPAGAQVVFIIQGAVSTTQFGLHIGALSTFEKFGKGFGQALEYKEYNPRTINFLEGPMRNGKYINKAFFRPIIILLLLAVVRYLFSSEKKQKKNAVCLGIGVLVFFRIFFDFFSTVNEVKMYNQTMSATNIMDNGRVGRTSDFYQFLDFIKTKVSKGEKGFFIAPYPFYFEGKYHIYPDVKFDLATGVDYLFFYNPYGDQTPSDFKTPVYADGVLTWDTLSFPVQEEIVRKPYAKIYLLKK